MNYKSIILLTLILIANTCYAHKFGDTAREHSETAELLQTANQLVRYGYQTKTALPLIQAIEIYNRLGVTTAKREKTTEETAVEDTIAKTSIVSFDTEQIIADAIMFADGDKNLLAQIKSVQGTRGRVGPGPMRHYDTVKAHATDTYSINITAGELTMFIVSGDGDTDLDLYVYDPDNNLVAFDADDTDDCLVEFAPRTTGIYKIKVMNLGGVYNRYVLASNLHARSGKSQQQ